MFFRSLSNSQFWMNSWVLDETLCDNVAYEYQVFLVTAWLKFCNVVQDEAYSLLAWASVLTEACYYPQEFCYYKMWYIFIL